MTHGCTQKVHGSSDRNMHTTYTEAQSEAGEAIYVCILCIAVARPCLFLARLVGGKVGKCAAPCVCVSAYYFYNRACLDSGYIVLSQI